MQEGTGTDPHILILHILIEITQYTCIISSLIRWMPCVTLLGSDDICINKILQIRRGHFTPLFQLDNDDALPHPAIKTADDGIDTMLSRSHNVFNRDIRVLLHLPIGQSFANSGRDLIQDLIKASLTLRPFSSIPLVIISPMFPSGSSPTRHCLMKVLQGLL